MSSAAARRVKSWRRYRLNLLFSSQPQYCCGCLWLAPNDARRVRRVFSIVRQVTRPPRSGQVTRSVGSGGLGRTASFPAQLAMFTVPSHIVANSAQAISEGFKALFRRLRGQDRGPKG